MEYIMHKCNNHIQHKGSLRAVCGYARVKLGHVVTCWKAFHDMQSLHFSIGLDVPINGA